MTPAPGTRVLITDAGERSMLATCRGLHAGGYQVSGASFEPLATSRWSRCCSDSVRMSDPRVGARAFIADLRRYLEHTPCALVIPGSDFSLLAVSRERDELIGLTGLGLPAHATVQRSLSRQALGEAAAAAGMPAATSVLCTGPEDAIAAAREIGYPVVLKSIAVVSERGPAVVAGADTRRIQGEQALLAVAAKYGTAFLVQRAEAGRPVSFGGVMAGGEMLGASFSSYHRTWPAEAGNASFAETGPAPHGLTEQVTALLGHVGWEGMFELEFIQRGDGTLVPIDLNPRPYGSMALAIAAGANLPAIWADWVLEGKTAAARAVPGRRYRWEDADMRHGAWQLRHGRVGAAVEVFTPGRRVVHPHFRADDPLPMLARILYLARAKLVALLGRLRPGG